MKRLKNTSKTYMRRFIFNFNCNFYNKSLSHLENQNNHMATQIEQLTSEINRLINEDLRSDG